MPSASARATTPTRGASGSERERGPSALLLAVFSNELRLLLRDRGAIVWLLLGPLLVMSVITAARYQSGGAPRLRLPVVDEDQGPVARAFVKLLAERVDVGEVSRAEAESLVRDRSRAAAAIVFPEGLSRGYLRGGTAQVLLLTDPAEPVGLGRVKMALLLMGRDAAELADPTGPPRLEIVEQNLTGDRPSRKSHEQNVPGFTIMFTLLGVAYGTASTMHREQRSGTLARLLVAPVGFGRVLYAMLALRVLVGALQMLVLLVWGWLAFDVSLGTSATAVLALSLATALGSVGLGALIAGLGRSDAQVLPLVLALVLPLSAVSGLWWPLPHEPGWMRTLGTIAFPSWAMRGVTDLVLRDRGFAAIAGPAGIVVVQGMILMLAGVWLFRARAAHR